MPVFIRRDPFGGKTPAEPRGKARSRTPKPTLGLRTPQARVLAALQPNSPDDPWWEWPVWNRAMLGVRAGYTAISGSITRALNGIHEGSSSGDPHLGLLALGYVEEVVLDIEGVEEVNYKATAAGVMAYQEYLAAGGELPQVREAAICINNRYKRKRGEKVEERS